MQQTHERHVEVEVAWRCAQQVRSVYHQDTPAAERAIVEQVFTTFASCPIPEFARLGRTLKQWREPFLGHFTTAGASNGGTEAVNGLIELHRRIARGFSKPRQLPTPDAPHRRRATPVTHTHRRRAV